MKTKLTGKPQNVRHSQPHPLKDVINPKQQAFIAAYISNGWNATAAAKSAGYGAPSVRGSQLLRIIKIKNAINADLDRHKISAKHVLSRLSEIANCNVADFLDEDGKILWSEVKKRGHLVKKQKRRAFVSKNGDSIVEESFELHDAQAALIQLGNHLGLFQNRPAPLNEECADFKFILKVSPDEMP